MNASEGGEDSFAFGQVFSDEDESSWTDESDFDFLDGADEDERGYDVWRRLGTVKLFYLYKASF